MFIDENMCPSMIALHNLGTTQIIVTAQYVHRYRKLRSHATVLVSVSGTGLLAGDAPNRVHVVITHVSTVSGLVFRGTRVREVLADCNRNVGGDAKGQAETFGGEGRGGNMERGGGRCVSES